MFYATAFERINATHNFWALVDKIIFTCCGSWNFVPQLLQKYKNGDFFGRERRGSLNRNISLQDKICIMKTTG